MIKATGIPMEGQPYLTKIEDQNGKTMIINSSRMESEYLAPNQLVQAGLAGCMAMTVKGELFTSKLSYRDVVVEVNMINENDNYTFEYKITVDSDEDPELIEAAKKRAADRCYVKGILAANNKVFREVE